MHTDLGKFDVVIAGGGVAGTSAALKILSQAPNLSVAVVEKNPSLGGRTGNFMESSSSFVYGLDKVSYALGEFLAQLMLLDPESEDEFWQRQALSFGSLIAGKVSTLKARTILSKGMATKIAGGQAGKHWEDFDKLVQRSQAEEDAPTKGGKPIGKIWPHPKKSAPSIALDQLTPFVGIPDIWAAHEEVLVERALQWQDGWYSFAWQRMFTELAPKFIAQHGGKVMQNCRVLAAVPHAEGWEVRTAEGSMLARCLVVAQHPWDVSEWLADEHNPTEVLAFASKTQPASVVSLSEQVNGSLPETLPDLIMVPSEACLVHVNAGNALCIQSIIPFEFSLSAPNVVKAVKRLRRAKKKLISACEGLESSESEHLALLSVGYAQSYQPAEMRYVRAMDPAKIAGSGLFFCGDAYGVSYNTDRNLIKSVCAASDGVIAHLAAQISSPQDYRDLPQAGTEPYSPAPMSCRHTLDC